MAPHHSIPGQDWTLDAAARAIVRDGRRVHLAEKPFLVLQALVEARGEVVTRAALRQRLWSDDTVVDFDNNLNSAVATLRQVLADRARSPRCIETIPKVGYRLIVSGDSVGALRELVAGPAEVAADQGMRHSGAASRPRLSFVVRVAATLGSCAIVALLGWRAWTASPPTPTPTPTATRSADPAARAHFERGLYLRSRYFASADAQPSQLTGARDAFAEAARIDARFADAAAEEGDTLVEMSFAGAIAFRTGLERARAAGQRALAVDASHPVAARVMGLTTLFLEWDFPAARHWLDRAAARATDARTALAEATWLAAAGRTDEAVAAAERAVALDPAAYYVRADLAMFYLAAGRDAEAAASSRRVLEVAPGFAPARALAVIAHERLEQWTEAAEHARTLMRAGGGAPEELARIDLAQGRDAVQIWRRWDLSRLERQAAGRRADFALPLALRFAALGDRDAALRELRQALAHRSALLVFLRSFPELVPLRGDPGFEHIARAVYSGPVGSADGGE